MENRSLSGKKITREQCGAIARSIFLGRRLQQEHPEIAMLYRQGMNLVDIISTINPPWCDIRKKVVMNAISFAIRGYNGRYEGLTLELPYTGLIQDESELEKLNREHKIMSGLRTYTLKKGIYAIPQELSQAWRKGLFAQGKFPWRERQFYDTYCSLSEIEFAYKLSLSPSYKRGKKMNSAAVADTLNEYYHKNQKIRGQRSVNIALYRYRKKISLS